QTTLLITGGAGFIGANFIHYMLEQYPDYHLINVDKLTYAGSKANLKTVLDHPKHTFIQADIADAKSIEKIFQDYPINGVIHFAAESHVDRSIQDSSDFVKTNVLGTLNLLQAAKEKWSGPSERQTNRFHYISTDEIYGALGDQGMFSEQTPYDPRNPYSASKASANLMVKSFGHTYDMNVIISSCSNNYGPM